MHNTHVVVFDFKFVSTAVVVFLELIRFTCKEDMTENFQFILKNLSHVRRERRLDCCRMQMGVT